MTRHRTTLTTGQLANLLCLDRQTVRKLIDSGHITGYRNFGVEGRRVHLADALRYAQRSGLRSPDLERAAAEAGLLSRLPDVLVVSMDDRIAQRLANLHTVPFVANDWFTAGSIAARQSLDALVVDTYLGRQPAVSALEWCQRTRAILVQVFVLAAEDDPWSAMLWRQAGAAECWKRPCDTLAAADEIAARLHGRN